MIINSKRIVEKKVSKLKPIIISIIDSINLIQELKIEEEKFGNNSIPKLPIHENRTEFKYQDMLVPWKLKESKINNEKLDTQVNPQIFLRYYHVFQEGELEQLCFKVEGVEIEKSFYDQGNWCVILKKII